MDKPSRASLLRAVPTAICALIGLVFALGAWRFFITRTVALPLCVAETLLTRNLFDPPDPSDRYQCSSLLTSGQWLDDERSKPGALANWQPDGCMLSSYTPKNAYKCLSGRRVVFAGDSTVRQLFYATAKILDPAIQVPDYYASPPPPSADDKKHQDVTLSIGGGVDGPGNPHAITLDFVWDAYLNTSKVIDMLGGPTLTKKPKPALLVLGSGLWQLRAMGEGGMQAWSQSMDRVFEATAAGHTQIADEVILLPVQHVIPEKLNQDRKMVLTPAAIARMNDDLERRLPKGASSAGSDGTAPGTVRVPTTFPGGIAQISIPYVFNDLISTASNRAFHTIDGIHLDTAMTKTMSNILLNLRCNDVLPKQFPFDRTCCNQYPAPNWLQGLLIFLILVWAPIGGHFIGAKTPNSKRLSAIFPPQHVLTPLSIFGFAIIYQYFGDRTSLFLKVQKQFEFWPFTLAMLGSLALGVGTVKKPEKDLGFLNRDQTDEWKGWMQIAILIYHYYGASKISGVYNPIRVLVAAYLFMSGYGHFHFYYKKADFGLARIAAVLIRLNLLTVVLAYVQDTDYLSYYFSPLTTLWFIVIWLTMFVGHKYNTSSTPFMLAKIAISAAIMTAIHKISWPLPAIFQIFNSLFATEWNAREWSFRVTLDMWIVYIGMLAAFAYIKITDQKLWERSWWPVVRRYSIIVSAIIMLAYFGFELQYNKLDYNLYHPYISAFPVLAFIVLRNATPLLRSTSSKAFIWIGKCSLETFICQFHIWLAGDTKGILMLLPNPRLRFLNLIVSTVIFLFVSQQIAEVTGDLTDWLCGKKSKPAGATRKADVLPTSMPSKEGGTEYVALSQIDNGQSVQGNKEAAGANKLNAHTRQPSVPSADQGPIGRALVKLPVRCVVILCTIWAVNLLYPRAHPSQGHLLPGS